MIANKIYVHLNEQGCYILEFPKCNVFTQAYVGVNGLTNNKKEGDGKTPIGEFSLGIILGTHTKEEMVNISNYTQIMKDMYWVDDSKSIYYNKLVNIEKVKRDWNSAEHLIDYPIQYEYLVEIKANPKNISGKGSAIFMHCTNGKPTAGCVAVNTHVMKKIIENIDTKTKIKIY